VTCPINKALLLLLLLLSYKQSISNKEIYLLKINITTKSLLSVIKGLNEPRIESMMNANEHNSVIHEYRNKQGNQV